VNDRFFVPRYKLKEDFRRTLKGVETIIPKGTVVEPLQEVKSYIKRTERVQIVYRPEGSEEEVIVWVHMRILSRLR